MRTLGTLRYHILNCARTLLEGHECTVQRVTSCILYIVWTYLGRVPVFCKMCVLTLSRKGYCTVCGLMLEGYFSTVCGLTQEDYFVQCMDYFRKAFWMDWAYLAVYLYSVWSYLGRIFCTVC